jgi:hypothetical protein
MSEVGRLPHCVMGKLGLVPVVVTTVLCTPDDGCREHPKHVEW